MYHRRVGRRPPPHHLQHPHLRYNQNVASDRPLRHLQEYDGAIVGLLCEMQGVPLRLRQG